MKIYLFIKALDNSGGTERCCIVLANELVKRGYDVGIISLVGDNQPFFEVSEQVKLHYLYKAKDRRIFPYRDIARYIALRKIFKAEKPDIILIVDAARSFLMMPATKGFTTITWEHFNVNVNWHIFHGLSRRLAAKFSDHIITLTNIDAELYKTKLGARRVYAIPNPVTIDASNPTKLTEKNILALGRYCSQKGFDYLIKAWAKVPDKLGWKLLIVGGGRRKKMYEKLIDKYNLSDSIELLPITKDVLSLYQKSSIYALSSRFEGLPLVLIEATAMGLPVVSFDCETGPRDIVEHNKTGFLVETFDLDKFAEALVQLMKDEHLRKEFSDNAIQLAKQKFDLSVITDSWENLFKQLKNSDK